jgi:hypothetical protein
LWCDLCAKDVSLITPHILHHCTVSCDSIRTHGSQNVPKRGQFSLRYWPWWVVRRLCPASAFDTMSCGEIRAERVREPTPHTLRQRTSTNLVCSNRRFAHIMRAGGIQVGRYSGKVQLTLVWNTHFFKAAGSESGTTSSTLPAGSLVVPYLYWNSLLKNTNAVPSLSRTGHGSWHGNVSRGPVTVHET